MQLKEGEFFLRRNLDQPTSTGCKTATAPQGYVFANVQQELRFEEEPGELTVVFSVEEGSRYAVGEINIHIAGDTPHTRFNTVLNRLMFRPGDVVDTRKSATPSAGSGLQPVRQRSFEGPIPKITFTPPGEEDETGVAERPSQGRPTAATSAAKARTIVPGVKKLDMHLFVNRLSELDPICWTIPVVTRPQAMPMPPRTCLPSLRAESLLVAATIAHGSGGAPGASG